MRGPEAKPSRLSKTLWALQAAIIISLWALCSIESGITNVECNNVITFFLA